MEKEPNTEPKPEEEVLSLDEYVKVEKEEILSPENKWFAGEKLGHSPTDDEAAEYYVQHGGAAGFAERHLLKAKKEKEERNKKKEDN